jgi:phosphate:Na+ symporter
MADLHSLIGGLGLFLLGMVLLTDGLKTLAGDALRRILMRFVSGPFTGFVSGAAVTALVQSSTATTVTTIGFVSAGLLTFQQSLGVIFGANLGTTSTGWIVSILGFKVSLGGVAAPLVLAGVVLRLLGRGRAMHAGTALCGFGLLFLGIDLLQHGMAGTADQIDLAAFAGSGIAGHAVLVLAGAAMTVVVQSSSAAIATTLAAVQTGAITLEQAAALAIGQNIGTTVTAGLASLGAPAAARRTALAHVLFNGLTGAVALFAMPLLLQLVRWAFGAEGSDAAVALAGFHTAFNLLGVLLLMPLLMPFARLIERVVPDRGRRATRFLGAALATVGPVAQEATRRALREVLAEAAQAIQGCLTTGRLPGRAEALIGELEQSVREVRAFVHGLGRAEQTAAERARHVALFHATDHLARLLRTLREPPDAGIPADGFLIDPVRRLGAACAATADPGADPDARAAESASAALADRRRTGRHEAMVAAAEGRLAPEAALARIEALLWLDRLGYHVWRAASHLQPKPSTEQALADPQRPRP